MKTADKKWCKQCKKYHVRGSFAWYDCGLDDDDKKKNNTLQAWTDIILKKNR